MPIFRPLDTAKALQMLEGQQNMLAPASKELERLYDKATCPECGSDACSREFLSLEHSLPKGALAPRSGLRCRSCGCVFDPHSGVIVKTTSAIAPAP